MIDTLARALAAQYEIIREIGRGGMGVVYLARDRRLDRDVAIKVLPPHLAADWATRERFLKEARTAAALSHQHIVPIHHADEVDGQVFFVMGYIEGESLAQRLQRDPRPTVREVLTWLRDVASALAYAHERGVVHRDIKAENILLQQDGSRALVTDFGIARLTAAGPMTVTGQILGTVHYMSPEQALGESLDGRSDLYSLGVVAWLALAGRFPFEDALASAVIVSHVNRPPPSLAEAAPALDARVIALVDRCLSKAPEQRPPHAAAVADAIAAILPTLTDAEVAAASPLLVSATEAAAVWKRAAELQAMTNAGSVRLVRQRDVRQDAARTSGYSVENIREGARGSLIDTGAVNRALVEHGLAGGSLEGEMAVARSPGAPERPNAFLGAHTRIDLEAQVDREFTDDELDDLIEDIRRTVGNPGTVSQVGRTVTWITNASGSPVHVTLGRKAGRTTIRAFEDLRPDAGGVFSVVLAIGGLMVGTVAGALLMKYTGSGLLAGAAVTSIVGGAYSAARSMLRLHVRERGTLFTSLIRRLGARITGRDLDQPEPPKRLR